MVQGMVSWGSGLGTNFVLDRELRVVVSLQRRAALRDSAASTREEPLFARHVLSTALYIYIYIYIIYIYIYIIYIYNIQYIICNM